MRYLTNKNSRTPTRRLNPDDQLLANGVKITQDGHTVQCLRVWIGNHLDNVQPWTPIINKISNTFNHWNKSNPTLDAKKLIIQMTVGSMTQFLTKAQGMPKSVLSTLTKLTRNFIWNGSKSSLLSLGQLQCPKIEGRIGLLNLEA